MPPRLQLLPNIRRRRRTTRRIRSRENRRRTIMRTPCDQRVSQLIGGLHHAPLIAPGTCLDSGASCLLGVGFPVLEPAPCLSAGPAWRHLVAWQPGVIAASGIVRGGPISGCVARHFRGVGVWRRWRRVSVRRFAVGKILGGLHMCLLSQQLTRYLYPHITVPLFPCSYAGISGDSGGTRRVVGGIPRGYCGTRRHYSGTTQTRR